MIEEKINWKEVWESPQLTPKEMDLLLKLDNSSPVYTNVSEQDISIFSEHLMRLGYSPQFFIDTRRSKFNGGYIFAIDGTRKN